MNVQNAGVLSLGEWEAIWRGYLKAHGGGKPEAPTEDEFDAAVARARGL